MTRFFTVLSSLVLATGAIFQTAQMALAQAVSDPSRASTILVFDASNSMWGQIDGVSKIEIARKVIADMLAKWDPGVDLGLVAYGHRRKGDCGDIESLIPVGPVDAKSFAARVNALVPRGKTPLTEAVRTAAEILNYRDTQSTVILVSDGIESCGANLCELADELERGGVNFTAHVIGFDVSRIGDQKQLSCLADRTGGKYLTADTASELTLAFQEVAAPPPPPPPVLRLVAVETANGPVISDPSIRWTLVSLDTEATVLGEQAMASPELEVKAGRYFARAELDGRVGSVEFDFSGDADQLQRLVLAITVTLEAPDTVEVGKTLPVTWTGPNTPGDFISIARGGTQPTAFEAYARTSGGSPASLTAPLTPGGYELRYVAASTGAILATAQVQVIDPSATLDAPPQVEAGSGFVVIWTGPDVQGDYITIVEAGAKDSVYGSYAYTRNGSPADMRAPDTAGPHELRYISTQTRSVIARLPIMVVGAAASLDAAPAVSAGADLAVSWTGPDNQGDYITIVPAGAEEKSFGNYSYTNRGTPVDLRMPDEPGAYELRYITGQTRQTLASLPVTVTGVTATLEAAPTIAVGAELLVTWTGPDNQGDYITVVPTGADEGKFGKYSYTRYGSPLNVRMPDVAGNYELRYSSGQTRATLATLPISVTAVTASLEAPPTAAAGSKVPVTWVGPDNQGDYITIVPVGAAEKKFGNYTYTRTGTPTDLQMPDEPGAYEIRYSSGQTRMTLASLPISVTAVTVSLEAPPTAAAGSNVPVAWVGPDNQGDYITIVPVGTEEKKFGKYAYTRTGSPANLQMPDQPGAYELRYSSGQTRTTLASLPITVTEVSVSLDAAPSVSAGAELQVTWAGPDNKNDFITVVPVGTAEKKFGNYTYTRQGSPLNVLAPEEPGSYEIRYLSGQTRTTLASLPVTVAPVTAELTAPPSANAGSQITVVWTGPDNKNDHITIVPQGSGDDERAKLYSYTRAGSPLDLQSFETPGAYELRYITGKSRRVLARLPITLLPVTAQLDAPPVVTAGQKFEVTWTGPDNKNDSIVVAFVDSEGRERITSAYTYSGNPLMIMAPREKGTYELRYVTPKDKNILARLPITVN